MNRRRFFWLGLAALSGGVGVKVFLAYPGLGLLMWLVAACLIVVGALV